MPYMWMEPDIVLRHNDVDIFAIFPDDNVTNPARAYWYGFDGTCADGIDDGAFDMRDVAALLSPEIRAACHGDHRAILTALIDAGCLHAGGVTIDGDSYDSASRIREAVNAHTSRQEKTPDGVCESTG